MNFKKIFCQVLLSEAEAISRAADFVNEENVSKLVLLYQHLQSKSGSLIFCGVGKSGVIAQKLSSTFASLGLRSFFLHPTEALHGDLGRVGEKDAIVFLSKSGTTEEIVKLMPYLPVSLERRIGLLGNVDSVIGKGCGIVFDCSVEKEACLNDQAPTTSSTVALAVGDAMAILWESFIGLSREEFALNHPGGILGKRLRLRVRDIMVPSDGCAQISKEASLKEAIIAMTEFPLGACAVVDHSGNFAGIVVDGDIRRAFAKEDGALLIGIEAIYNRVPKTIGPDDLAMDALEVMEGGNRNIQTLPVIEGKRFLGMIRIHDLFREGFGSRT